MNVPPVNPPGSPEGLPPPVGVDLDQSLLAYTRERLRQHTLDSYAGVRISKFPEDLRVYEHLLWIARPSVVIELGVQYGGSSLWFRDRLRTLAHYSGGGAAQVVAVDVEVESARECLAAADPGYASGIHLIEGDVLDPELPDRVRRLLGPDARALVIEDTAHVYDTTMAALRGFAPLVAADGFFVVEDGIVDDDELRISADWPRGVRPAVEDWLAREGSDFRLRRDLELYGVTCHPGGFLQRRPGETSANEV